MIALKNYILDFLIYHSLYLCGIRNFTVCHHQNKKNFKDWWEDKK
jgi:hypothetical protein